MREASISGTGKYTYIIARDRSGFNRQGGCSARAGSLVLFFYARIELKAVVPSPTGSWYSQSAFDKPPRVRPSVLYERRVVVPLLLPAR
jgi:hypothetical protein